ncbi:helix-turn-helix domain-containing protein [Bacillus manliponensis]|uniref:helix-turn-helix domain-containing protein n=1 Tax=Bacillus manliponensis TaxID=574376 RepID=UPI00351801CF
MQKMISQIYKLNLSQPAKYFLYVLADLEGKEIKATYEKLTDLLQCSRNTLSKTLKELTDSGYIEIIPGQGRRPSTYRFNC